MSPEVVTPKLITKCYFKHFIIFNPEGGMLLISFLYVFQLKYKNENCSDLQIDFFLHCQETDLEAVSYNRTCEK